MKLKRISDNTIRCTVSAEEMDQYEINLDDLLGHRDKAENFFRRILRQAEEELGFEANAGDLNVQLSVLPKGDVSMMISKGDSVTIGDMISHITEALDGLIDEKSKDALNEIVSHRKKEKEDKPSFEKSAKKNSNDFGDGLKHGKDAARQKAQEVANIDLTKKAPTEEDIAIARVGEELNAQRQDLFEQLRKPLWAAFSSMDQAIQMVRRLDPEMEIPAELYERYSIYYLRMNFTDKIEEASNAVLLISEFADTVYVEDTSAKIFKEHANTILKKDAIDILRSL